LAVLVAVGVTPTGKREILGVSVSLSKHEVHWRAFLESLKQRGLDFAIWSIATIVVT
jgi:putative transposase